MARPVLSLVIPAFREEERLGQTLPAFASFLAGLGVGCEIVVVDDGSADRTAEIVETFSGDGPVPVRLVRHPARRGKGEAVRTGILAAAGEQVFFTDADLPYDLRFLSRALPRLREGAADVVIGGRDLPDSREDRAFPWLRRVFGKTYALLVRGALGLGFGDTQCGIKGFRGDIARELVSVLTIPGFGFDAELLFVARRWGLRIERLPVTLHHRGRSSVRLAGDSLRMLGDLFRIRRNQARGRYRRRPAPRAGDEASGGIPQGRTP